MPAYARREQWMRDTRAEDGCLIRGWRKVKNGKVKFDSRVFEHEILADFENKFVPVTWDAYWMINATVNLHGLESVTLTEVTDYKKMHEKCVAACKRLVEDAAPANSLIKRPHTSLINNGREGRHGWQGEKNEKSNS